MANQQRTITNVVRELMAQLPEVEEFVSHGAPNFRVRGKTFATYNINHHGDGRVALLLAAPKGAQAALVRLWPRVYFVPAYVGPRGWLGIELDKGLSWSEVCEHTREAYSLVAPAELERAATQLKLTVRPPTRKFRPDEIDRFQSQPAQAVLKRLAAICQRLPETAPATMFGCPVWRAGKKTFAVLHYYTGRLKLCVWVGPTRQRQLTQDPRFEIARYVGRHGWINLDVETRPNWQEIEPLVVESYRHHALKRMLTKLEDA